MKNKQPNFISFHIHFLYLSRRRSPYIYEAVLHPFHVNDDEPQAPGPERK